MIFLAEESFPTTHREREDHPSVLGLLAAILL